MALILVVEDHPLNRKLVRDILQFQFDAAEAVSAEAALDYIHTHPAPDLILMDVQLPGMDGLTLTRLLKADLSTARIPIVALSAHALPRDIQRAREAGCVDYITKPITDDPFTFLERIARRMAAPPPTGGRGPADRTHQPARAGRSSRGESPPCPPSRRR